MSLGVEMGLLTIILSTVARCPLNDRRMTCGAGTRPSVLNALTTKEKRRAGTPLRSMTDPAAEAEKHMVTEKRASKGAVDRVSCALLKPQHLGGPERRITRLRAAATQQAPVWKRENGGTVAVAEGLKLGKVRDTLALGQKLKGAQKPIPKSNPPCFFFFFLLFLLSDRQGLMEPRLNC